MTTSEAQDYVQKFYAAEDLIRQVESGKHSPQKRQEMLDAVARLHEAALPLLYRMLLREAQETLSGN